MQDSRVQCYEKLAKNLKEGDVAKIATGDGHKYYYMDTDAYPLEEAHYQKYEIFVYSITEEQLTKYFFDSDISFRDNNPDMDVWSLGDGNQYVNCLDQK